MVGGLDGIWMKAVGMNEIKIHVVHPNKFRRTIQICGLLNKGI